MRSAGPLAELRVVEVGGIGPAPFAAMLLADLGADIIRVDRPGSVVSGLPAEDFVLHRSRRSIILDLKKPAGVETVLRLVERADVLVEGFRPGVTERLGLGPKPCLARNPRLVYGRMTGWGQQGPRARTAGHDINYIALTGALHAIGERGRGPVPPLNLVGDFGGGGMLLALGVLAALLEARSSGRGQVVDAAIVDGAATLMALAYALHRVGSWTDARGSNFLDGGCPWYGAYETADGRWMAVGANEPQFFEELAERLGIDPGHPGRHDSQHEDDLRTRIAAAFRTKTRDEWDAIFETTDACATPVLALGEVADSAHATARGAFVEYEGVVQPAAAPRFSRTPGAIQSAPSRPGEDTRAALADWGITGVEELIAAGVAQQA